MAANPPAQVQLPFLTPVPKIGMVQYGGLMSQSLMWVTRDVGGGIELTPTCLPAILAGTNISCSYT